MIALRLPRWSLLVLIAVWVGAGELLAQPPLPAAEGAVLARVRTRRIDSVLLVHAGEIARALGWEAKLVAPGKLLTLCRGGEDGVCVPLRLERLAFRETPEGLYIEAEAVARALRVRIEQDGRVHGPDPDQARAQDDDIPAYNAAWGAGRGFREGQTLPDIPLIDLDGREVRFSDFLGKQYILYCWASW